jgi:glycosyltransferase involved in cell wall biosynthesis
VQSDDGSSNEFVAAASERGLEVDVIRERKRFDLNVIFALRKIVKARAPQIIVTHSVKSHFLLWRSKLWQQIPWVAFHHGYTTTDRKMRLYNRLDRWSLPHADRLITVCQAFAADLADSAHVPFQRISVQHNSIRPQPPAGTADTKALRSLLGLAPNERIVLAVGRLSREKAHLDLLKAFSLLRKGNPQIACRLVIVGEGPERAKLQTACESLDIKEQVILAGQTSDVQAFYAAADLLASSSHSEGSPYVLLEAMAAGLPIVATSVGGVPEIVEQGQSALLVPAADPPALAAAILRVLGDRDLASRLTANASTLVTTKHSPEQYVRSLDKIYREVLQVRQT